MNRKLLSAKRKMSKKIKRIQYLNSLTFQEIDKQIADLETELAKVSIEEYQDRFVKEYKPELKKRFYFLLKLAMQDSIKSAGQNIDFGSEAGSCQCGKKIRYGYPIFDKNGITITLGSVCIKTVSLLNSRWVDPYLDWYKSKVRSLKQRIAEMQTVKQEKKQRMNPFYNFREFIWESIRESWS